MSQQINLYNSALRPPRELISATNLVLMAGICLVFVAVIGGAARYALHRATAEADSAAAALKSAQDQLAAANAEIAARQPSAALQQEVAETQALLKGREEVLTALATVSIEPGKGFADYMRGLARQSLQGVWLTGVSIGPGSELSLRGRTLDQSLVADYVKRLTGERIFIGHRFAQLTMTKAAPASTGTETTAPTAAPAGSIEFNLLTSPAEAAKPASAASGAASPVNIASLAGGAQ